MKNPKLKNPTYLTLSMMLFIVGLILLFIEPLYYVGIPVMLTGIILFIHWSTISYRWVCGVCGHSFEISFWQNLLGFNYGINQKNLICPKCDNRTLCKGVPK